MKEGVYEKQLSERALSVRAKEASRQGCGGKESGKLLRGDEKKWDPNLTE